MVRLITLKLQPVPRPAKQTVLPPLSHAPQPISVKSPHRAELIMSPVLNLPQTQRQWRAALDEVRNSYLMRRYRQCSARCIQLLECAPNMVLALHCIYLSFYAAICLELLARALPDSSCQKLSTFYLARSYYERAAHYMWDIERGHNFPNIELGCKSSLESYQQFHPSFLDSESTSERSSVANSPTMYTFSPPIHSPASSICSSFSKFEEEPIDPLKPQPLRVKKSVNFHAGCTGPMQTWPNDTSNGAITSDTPLSEMQKISSKPDSSFVRFNIHLSTLRTQLTHHLSSVMHLILTLERSTQIQPMRPPSQPYSTIPTTTQPQIYPSLSGPAYTEDPKEDDQQDSAQSQSQQQQQQRAQARAARIAALKHRGEEWKCGRGRFDAKRYERLCSEALRELAGGQSGNYC